MSRWKGNIEMGLKEIGWVGGNGRMCVIYESHQRRSIMDIVTNLRVL